MLDSKSRVAHDLDLGRRSLTEQVRRLACAVVSFEQGMRRSLEARVVQHTPEAHLFEYDEFFAYDETPMQTLTKH